MFAIFGMSLQKDKMWYCNIPPSISNITIFDIHSEAEVYFKYIILFQLFKINLS